MLTFSNVSYYNLCGVEKLFNQEVAPGDIRQRVTLDLAPVSHNLDIVNFIC